MPRYPHLLISAAPDSKRFTSTRSGRDNLSTPRRNRAAHAKSIINQFQAAQNQRPPGRQIGNGFYQSTDLTLSFESEPNFDLAFESLEMSKSGIDLLSVVTDATNRTIATVRIPEGKIATFLKKLEAYRDNDPAKPRTDGKRPGRDNRRLAESISNIRRATLRSFWTDEDDAFPQAGQIITWEVWLRRAHPNEQAPAAILEGAQNDLGYKVVSKPLTFIDRTVILVRGTPEQLSDGSDFLGIIAELRKAKITAGFFDGLPTGDQHAWIKDLHDRTTLPSANAPFVGLLDTGVNRSHPLLADIIAVTHLHSYKPQWHTGDGGSNPHGTKMAGLALYGDLTPLLGGSEPVVLTHGLRSVKFINEKDPHQPELYGVVTQEAVARLELDPKPKRVYCMAVTADGSDRGRPSSWSSAVDVLAMGSGNDDSRLVIISAGNTTFESRNDYPASNELASIQDPAQSWNALTVGATTQKVDVDQNEYPGHLPLAEAGDLGPSSTTSLIWPRTHKLPFKPDIVMEGGNMARPGPGIHPNYIPDLSLLSTSPDFHLGKRPLITMDDTSAATALASRLAAALWAYYPDFTPETVRGMLIHSARWSPAMFARAAGSPVNLLRTFGYGTPDHAALMTSANNTLTLIAQSTIQPFVKVGADIKSNAINLHALPWPKEALQDLPSNTEVKLRVTLSYFIEPSPGERGWDKKYGYASHGLRIEVQRPTEDVSEFALRINAHDRDAAYDTSSHHGETGEWFFRPDLHTNGSVMSNVWRGTAAELANRSHIAVYPAMGWWRTRPKENRYEKSVRYSLIVSIETPDITTDIYTPVAALVGIKQPVPVDIEV